MQQATIKLKLEKVHPSEKSAPADLSQKTNIKHTLHQLDNLIIEARAEGFYLATAEGEIGLNDHDLIALDDLLLRVHLIPSGYEQPHQPIVPANDCNSPNRFIDPFAAPLTPPAVAPTSATPMTAINPPERLDFLEDHTNDAQAATGNILADLGIDATSATLAHKNYPLPSDDTLLARSPMDMLDEYLAVTEASTPVLPLESSPAVLAKPSWLQVVRQRVKKILA